MPRLALLVGLMAVVALAGSGCSGTTRPATGVQQTAATLHGSATWKQGQAGHWWFRYRRSGSSSWTGSTPHRSWGPTSRAGSSSRPAETVTGLSPSTSYEYQFCTDLTRPKTSGPVCWSRPSGFTTGPRQLRPGDSIARALAAAKPGDRIVLSEGSYGRVHTDKAFASEVVVEVAEGASVVTRGWRFLSGASHITVRGIQIAEPSVTDVDNGSAIRVEGAASHVTLEHLTVTQGRHGLRVCTWVNCDPGSPSLNPRRVKLSDSDISNVTVDGVQIAGGTDIEIDHNTIHDLLLDPVIHNDGIQAYMGTRVRITRNHVFFTKPQATLKDQGIIVGGSDDFGIALSDVTVANNLVHHWPDTQIMVAGVDGVKVVNNTAYDSPRGYPHTSLRISEIHGPNSDFTLANNIIGELDYANGGRPPDTCTRNLIKPGNASCGSGSELLTADPEFEACSRASDADCYRLRSGSPALGYAAKPVLAAGASDLSGLARSAEPDLGAHERSP